ncbi:hypothetical protein U14_02551 [Candidatus Moduliflexus flocculans]|uniref:Uncharacterized protein n=1 Tax=Candidatus Moduliflexus flocculans TaxID=1499966 RepID=A0A081BLP2_9BACT|nr:hypothetical protein U14_02551 [Candidatus Moduliflexus flocculans]
MLKLRCVPVVCSMRLLAMPLLTTTYHAIMARILLRHKNAVCIINTDQNSAKKIKTNKGINTPGGFERRDNDLKVGERMPSDFNIWQDHFRVFLGLQAGRNTSVFTW